MGLKLIRKLSTAKVLSGKIKFSKEQIDAGQTRRFLYQMAGIARGYKEGESNFGQWVGFTGDFAAILPDAEGKLTAEGFRAPMAFLPDPFSGMLKSGIQEMEQANADAKAAAIAAKTVFIPAPVAAEFKVNVYAVYDAKSSTEYTYEVDPVIKVKQSDALAGLLGTDVQDEAEDDEEETDTATGEVSSKAKGKKNKRK